ARFRARSSRGRPVARGADRGVRGRRLTHGRRHRPPAGMMKGSITLTQTRTAFALAKQAALPLEPPGNQGRTRSTSATLRDEGEMPTRRDIRAITRGAQARPGGALILGGLLLLMVP